MTTLPLAFPNSMPAAAAFAEGQPARLTGPAVPFGVASLPAGDGRRYRFRQGPENVDELVDVVKDHDPDALAGRLESWDVADDGMTGTARLFNTTIGRDVATEAAEGARTGFSVAATFDPSTLTEDAEGVIDVTTWSVAHLGVVRKPAFTAANQVTVHNSAHNREEPMPTTPEAPAIVELPTIAELAAQVAEHLDIAGQEAPTHPLAPFPTFAAFCAALAGAYEAGDKTKASVLQAAFAVPEQITDNNPGVIPPGWRTDIKMRLDKRQPAIQAFGRIGLPDAGMDDNWPYFDGDIDAMIAEQLTELDELAGIRVDIKKATEPIKTAGAVSKISYQLLMRSSPSYLAAYMTIAGAAFARWQEAKFETTLAARGTDAGPLPALTSPAAVKAELFEASGAVEDATGAPADIALVDKATFITLGGLDGLHNAKYGTQNAAGTASAATLKVDVNGLNIVRAPFLPAGTMIVSNSEAAKFPTTGMLTATAEDVIRLGRDVAVWAMYEDAQVYFPAGVRVYKPAP